MLLILQGVVFSIGFVFFGLAAASAAPIGNGMNAGLRVQQSGIEKIQYSYCQRLRWRCQNKEELGLEGQGTCRRYRQECGGWSKRSHCNRLRWRCEHKEELGLEGQGTCRTYRRQCGDEYSE